MSVLPTQPFGRTGHNSTRVIFSAAALARSSEEDGEQALALLLEHGVNHIDTAAASLLPHILAAAGAGGSRPSEAEMEELGARRGMAPLFA